MWLYCAFYKFLDLKFFKLCICRCLDFTVLSVFGSGSGCGNVPNELVHRVGPPFLDNHALSCMVINTSIQCILAVYI